MQEFGAMITVGLILILVSVILVLGTVSLVVAFTTVTLFEAIAAAAVVFYGASFFQRFYA